MSEAGTLQSVADMLAASELGFAGLLPRAARTLPEVDTAVRSRAKGQKVTLTGLSKSFGERRVFAGLDLTIPPGQFLAIVGRSGCGKTTLVRLVAGLDRPTSGGVRLDDRAVDSLQPTVRLLFQEARLLPWRRVIDNVGIARWPGWREAAEAALGDVGLADRAHDWPAILSGGQRQRVALARALVSQPGVLLLDEPFGALDALTRIDMHRLLDRIWRERQFTTLLITHDVAEAVALADRVIVIKEGKIALDMLIGLPRPRREAADPKAAAFQARILDEV